MHTDSGVQCVVPPLPATLPELTLPFEASTEVVCTHGSGIGSHAWTNSFFALDLANDYALAPATVLAAADGTAYVFGGDFGASCPEPAGTPAEAGTSACGDGWGNHVRIHHGGGIASSYVHLDHALVQTGDVVRRGQPIGVAGWTGLAGHRHLHFSVQRINGTTQTDWDHHMNWAGDSLPFRFLAQVDGETRTIDTATLRCAHAQVGGAPPGEQPRMRGLPR